MGTLASETTRTLRTLVRNPGLTAAAVSIRHNGQRNPVGPRRRTATSPTRPRAGRAVQGTGRPRAPVGLTAPSCSRG